MKPTENPVPLPRLPVRPRDGHKGTFGRVLVVAGSADYSGAAVLCGRAALRGGAGLVQVTVPETIRTIVAGGEPCYITAALPDTPAGAFSTAAIPPLLQLAALAQAVAIGPGLSQDAEIAAVVAALLEQVSAPIVLDADGLNALAALLARGAAIHRAAPLILTPHPGEFRRLCPSAAGSREEHALTFAARHSCVLVLKGHQSLVTDGTQLFRNVTGNPGMGTGGTGDVLTGLIAALLAQGMAPFAAAQLGVYLHGLAGDLAAAELGETSLIATDLLQFLPQAFRQQESAPHP